MAFAQGEGTHRSCLEQGFPMLRLSSNEAGHDFSSLPWIAAVEWLEVLTSDDAARLAKFAQQALDGSEFRDAMAAPV